jgi:hypothetical protein
VLGNVEIHAANIFNDIRYRIFAQQHAADRALLREQVVWRYAIALAGLPGFAPGFTGQA